MCNRVIMVFFLWFTILFPLKALSGKEVKNSLSKNKTKPPQEITVTATRKLASLFDVPFFGRIFSAEEIHQKKMPRTLPQILEEDASISVQKTSNAQGSPFIRGFTGFRNLLLIDGIRLNNSVFRDGPNQYWSTVDPFLIGQLEIIKGPSSVLYGSDAIGGTVNVITRTQKRGLKNGVNWKRRIYNRFGSADKSYILRPEIEGTEGRFWAFSGGVSVKDFGDIDGGKGIGNQPKTGFQELSGDFKGTYFLSRHSKLILAGQHTNQKNAWRSHKTIFGKSWRGTKVGKEKKRALDQDRNLLYLQFHSKNISKYLDSLKASLSYQYQQEYRFRIKSNDSSDRQGFDVGTLGFWTQLQSNTFLGDLVYGIEYYHDNVKSFSKKFNKDGSFKSAGIQGPIGDASSYDLLGLFLQNEVELLEDLLTLTIGVRYTYVNVDSQHVKNPTTGKKMSLSDNFDSLVANGRLIYYIHPDFLNIFTGLSQGFRAPNLSDLTRLDNARSNEIETPSPGLKPEKYLSFEIGSKWNFGGFKGQISYYYTWIQDMIIRFPTGKLIGTDQEIQKANIGNGYVQGIEVNGLYDLPFHFFGSKKNPLEREMWSVFGQMAWVEGAVDTYPTSAQVKDREPLSRLMPTTGILGIRWSSPSRKIWIEGLAKIVRRQSRLSTRDKGDTQRIPVGGTPGYTIFTLRGGIYLDQNLKISASLENIGNKAYRIHGSGQNEPGTNFLFSIDWKF